LASGSFDGEIRVWNATNATLLATFPGHTDKILGMAFSADNKKLWSGSADRTLRQWKLQTCSGFGAPRLPLAERATPDAFPLRFRLSRWPSTSLRLSAR
jgi:WD40 repeat protein